MLSIFLFVPFTRSDRRGDMHEIAELAFSNLKYMNKKDTKGKNLVRSNFACSCKRLVFILM